MVVQTDDYIMDEHNSALILELNPVINGEWWADTKPLPPSLSITLDDRYKP